MVLTGANGAVRNRRSALKPTYGTGGDPGRSGRTWFRPGAPRPGPVTVTGPGRDTRYASWSYPATIGFTPARSSRRTRIIAMVTTRPSSAMPAETMNPLEKPTDRACA
jgi:hypothetical protein